MACWPTNGHLQQPRFLIWGGNGWIAGQLKRLLEEQGKEVHSTTIRMENREAVLSELFLIRPTHVLNAAGCTGRPNVDWCEDNKSQTVRSNVIGTLNLADACFQAKIHCTIFATGCIYQYDTTHPIGGLGYTEEDRPNFEESFYSLTKSHVEPVSLPAPTSAYQQEWVCGRFARLTCFLDLEQLLQLSYPSSNSNTMLHDLLPASIILAGHGETGVYNFTNPGAISHNEVLTLFKEIVRPELEWKNFTLDEQAKVIKAGRSNCTLDTTKLVTKLGGYKYEIPEIHEAYRKCFKRMKAEGVK
ncbi:hypothetical protein V8C42DRAFT_311738 [Trichoderma barbatum]